MIFTDAEVAYLASQTLGRLASAQPGGSLQVNPVGFRYNADLDTIDIGGFGMSTSQKYRNVADNGRVAFVVDDIPSRQPWQVRFLEIRGTAEAVPSPVGEPGGSERGADAALIRIHPKKIISFGVEEIDAPHKTPSRSRTV
jgi:pyridoxamine 5'-phosphate oxidase family protein